MAVQFQRLASPQVCFTAVCTHSIRGSTKEGDRITHLGKNATKKMSDIARAAMEKVVTQLHVPSSVAGNADYFTFIMGDWNTTAEAMRTDTERAVHAAAAPGVLSECITAERAVGRDHVAFFSGSMTWQPMLDQNIAPQIYDDLKECTREHWPLFFHIQGDVAPPDVQSPQPATPNVVIPTPPSRPVPALEGSPPEVQIPQPAPPVVVDTPPPFISLPAFESLIPAATRVGAIETIDTVVEYMKATYRRLFPQNKVPATHPLLVICRLVLLSQVRRGQTKTDLFQGYSWKYLPFSVIASRKNMAGVVVYRGSAVVPRWLVACGCWIIFRSWDTLCRAIVINLIFTF